MRDEVLKTIEVIRPALQADGGDIVLKEIDEEAGSVTVELVGACGTCPASTVTMKAGRMTSIVLSTSSRISLLATPVGGWDVPGALLVCRTCWHTRAGGTRRSS